MTTAELTALLGAAAAVIVAVTGLVKSLRTDRKVQQHAHAPAVTAHAAERRRPGP